MLHTEIHVTPRCSRPKGALRTNQTCITNASKSLCRRLLESTQDVLKDSLFRDDLFEKTCRKIQDRNEARVIQDVSRLIVPSAETLATYGATDIDHLIEGVNEGIPSRSRQEQHGKH